MGKEMTCHELCTYIKKKADSSPRILNLLLDHVLGKPEEVVQATVTFILSPRPQEAKPIETQAVNIQVKDRFQLPPPPDAIEGDVGHQGQVHLVDSFEDEEKEGQEPF